MRVNTAIYDVMFRLTLKKMSGTIKVLSLYRVKVKIYKQVQKAISYMNYN